MSLLRSALRRRVARGLQFVLPSRCFACGRGLETEQRLGACSGCWAALEPIPSPGCRSCGAAIPSEPSPFVTTGGFCGPCALDPLPVVGAAAAVVYDRLARRIVLRAKDGKRPEILGVLGEQVAAAARVAGLLPGCEVVVAVPSHPWARLRRGFDPATEVARGVGAAARIRVAPGAIRQRWRTPAPAKELGVEGRRRAAAVAFCARALRGDPVVLLVDDVLTTGASARACSRALLERGASEVRLAVWARTPRRDTF